VNLRFRELTGTSSKDSPLVPDDGTAASTLSRQCNARRRRRSWRMLLLLQPLIRVVGGANSSLRGTPFVGERRQLLPLLRLVRAGRRALSASYRRTGDNATNR